MDTQSTRVTCEQAAKLAGVSMRTVRRWRAVGLIGVERDPTFRTAATYDPAEVLRAAKMLDLDLPAEEPETDISG